MMTEDLYGELSDPDRVSEVDEAPEEMDVFPSSVVVGDNGGYPAAAFVFSKRLISLVAWMPSITGIWISI